MLYNKSLVSTLHIPPLFRSVDPRLTLRGTWHALKYQRFRYSKKVDTIPQFHKEVWNVITGDQNSELTKQNNVCKTGNDVYSRWNAHWFCSTMNIEILHSGDSRRWLMQHRPAARCVCERGVGTGTLLPHATWATSLLHQLLSYSTSAIPARFHTVCVFLYKPQVFSHI